MQRISIEPVKKLDYTTMEEIKRLRTNLLFLEPDKKVINITSTVGKEGKSTVCFWLAYSLAELGKKVVLVDANIRSKEKNKVFTINNFKDLHESNMNKKNAVTKTSDSDKKQNNLTEFLQGNVRKEEVVCDTNITNLHLVPSGSNTANPSELLSGFILRDLIMYLKDNYDFVILDTPALGEVADAAIIAAQCDSSILVLEPGVTHYKLAQKAKEQLENSGTKLLGVILNKA